MENGIRYNVAIYTTKCFWGGRQINRDEGAVHYLSATQDDELDATTAAPRGRPAKMYVAMVTARSGLMLIDPALVHLGRECGHRRPGPGRPENEEGRRHQGCPEEGAQRRRKGFVLEGEGRCLQNHEDKASHSRKSGTGQ